tara:strand:+ start:317 stop:550 length:234 start_codon:yes stop_codon:yes gene_type:complete
MAAVALAGQVVQTRAMGVLGGNGAAIQRIMRVAVVAAIQEKAAMAAVVMAIQRQTLLARGEMEQLILAAVVAEVIIQ